MRAKKVLSLLLTGALMLTLMPTLPALAESDTGTYTFDVSEGGITIGAGTVSGLRVSYGTSESVDNIPSTQEITIIGTTTANTVTVSSGATANITLNAVNIDLSGGPSGVCAFDMSGATVEMKLIGSSTLRSSTGSAGICCPSGAELTVADGTPDGTGRLTVTTTGGGGVGIGGDTLRAGGTVYITGGTVTAIGGYCGAGIGGGIGSDGGTVYITGGMVTATGGDEGAGIGGGLNGNGGTVYITGGTVAATGGILSAGIGGGLNGNGGMVYISGGSVMANGDIIHNAQNIGRGNGGVSGTLKNNSIDNTDVYLMTVTLNGMTTEEAVSDITTDAGYIYGTNGMKTDTDGKLYLYLPDGKSTLAVETASVCYTGKVTAISGATPASGTLDPGDFTVTGSGYTYPNHVLTITGGSCEVSMRTGGMSPTTDKIVVNGGNDTTPVDITLNGVSIDTSGSDACAFELQGSSVVNLTLKGTNTLTSGSNYAGLQVMAGMKLTIDDGTIDSTGSLVANGGYSGAGIGGGFNGNSGTLDISGGTVTATGSYGGAGIGSGMGGGDGGTVYISGGMVTATGSTGGAGIGGGIGGGIGINGGDGGTVYISGGTVTATSISGGMGIGGGIGANIGDGGTITITGGTVSASSVEAQPTNGTSNVYLTTVTLENASGTAVSDSLVSALAASMSGSSYAYGTNDMYTDTDGKLYLYLPVSATVTRAVSSGLQYTGMVTSNNLGTAADTLTLLAVTGVTPSGAGTALGGNIAVIFSKTMNSAAGAVSLNGGTALTGGSWSADNKTYTVPYSGLSYSTSYTVTISEFEDAVGNTIIADSTHSFKTIAQSSGGGGSSRTYYTITSAAGTGGSISPSGSSLVVSGNNKTYTIAACEGYKIADVLVDGVSVGAVGTYSFENVKSAHTITAYFKKAVVNPFADVKTGDWFYDNIMYVYGKGLMAGTAADTFNPDSGMSRGMVVTVLYRLSGDTGSYANAFSDVPLGAWYENAVAWAAKNGIAGGVGNGRFTPNTEVTREQLAVMLWHYAKYKEYDVSIGEDTNILSYHDAQTISDYAYSALQWACGAGILNGDTNGNLNPQGVVTRAEVAAILQRFMENGKA